MEVEYIETQSFWLDLKIMLTTFATLVGGERLNRQAVAQAWQDINALRERLGAAHDHSVAEANPGTAESLQQSVV